ncbi:MAG: hemolysin III family protein [Deltaproteobacteria bacterium]|nr:hemolysin III family protein [Deltaproteobacteria bacterium]
MLHLLSAAFVAGMGAWLIRRGRSRGIRLALASFVVAATAMLALSGTYHLLDDGTTGRAVLRRLDHAAIWTMIAASFTAIHGAAFRGRWRWAFLTIVWVVALLGLVLKTVFLDSLPESAWLALYLALGWLGIVSAFALRRLRGLSGIRDFLLGGVAYSVGAAYDFARGPSLIPDVIGPHEIFHIAVVLGVALHWRFIAELATTRRCAAPSPAPRLCTSQGAGARIR